MLAENQIPVSEDIIPSSKKLFLFFGGIAGAIGMPPFEFYKASRILDHSKIFLRDISQAWYQRGLPSIGANAQAIGAYLKVKINEAGTSEVHFVGNSMGGYAALLFCAMLQLGEAIVFSPQTFISHEKRQIHGDDRWSDQIQNLHTTRRLSDIYDIEPWIQSRFPSMKARVYVSAMDVLESHASRANCSKYQIPTVVPHPQTFQGQGVFCCACTEMPVHRSTR